MRFHLSLATICLLLVASTARGQVAERQIASGGSGSADRPSVYVGTDLTGLYSPRYGIGFDGILGFRNIPFSGSSIRLHAWPSRFRRVAFATLSMTDPTTSPLVVSGHVLSEWNRRDRSYPPFYADEPDWVQYDRNSLVAALRAGGQLTTVGLSVLPYVRYEWHHIFNGIQNPALEESGPGFRPARDPEASAVFVGLDLFLDQTDNRVAPTRGFAANLRVESARNVNSEITCEGVCTLECRPGECPESFTRAIGDFFGYLSPWNGHVIAARIRLSDVVEGGAVPYYFQPVVDHRQLPGVTRGRFSPDRYALFSLEYRLPLGVIFDLYRFDFVLHSGVAVVESAFGSDPEAIPGFALGIRLASLANERILVNWRIGGGPEGFTFTPFRAIFQPDPRISYPMLR